MAGEIKCTTDHAVIKRWVEERGGWPAKYLRINFHGYVTRGAPRRVEWDNFFRAFEQRQLVFVYQEQTATGKRSHYFQLKNRRVEPGVDRRPDARAETPPAPPTVVCLETAGSVAETSGERGVSGPQE